MAQPFRIDVHHHPTPSEKIPAGRRAVPPNMKEWTAAYSLEDMDKNGVATAVLSLNHPVVVWPSDQSEARKQARAWNEFMTRQGQDHPGRFGTFAVLPILDIAGSLAEIEYALDTLKADGINMMTNIGDKWLGDPYYFPLFEELESPQGADLHSSDCPDLHHQPADAGGQQFGDRVRVGYQPRDRKAAVFRRRAPFQGYQMDLFACRRHDAVHPRALHAPSPDR